MAVDTELYLADAVCSKLFPGESDELHPCHELTAGDLVRCSPKSLLPESTACLVRSVHSECGHTISDGVSS